MSKKIILIVDDEPDVMTVTVTRLEGSGYEILQAKSSEEALEMLTKNRPDLILLDLLLPGIQGDTLCKKLKSDPQFKVIPIIIFTASTLRVPEKIKDMGADNYILKPFEAKELLIKIKQFIG